LSTRQGGDCNAREHAAEETAAQHRSDYTLVEADG
jgi:hypothetical protein